MAGGERWLSDIVVQLPCVFRGLLHVTNLGLRLAANFSNLALFFQLLVAYELAGDLLDPCSKTRLALPRRVLGASIIALDAPAGRNLVVQSPRQHRVVAGTERHALAAAESA